MSLNVASRDRKDVVDEGRYSEVEVEVVREEGVGLNGIAFRVRVAVRDKIAARCGAVFDRLSSLLIEDELLLRPGSARGGGPMSAYCGSICRSGLTVSDPF